jgi:translation initiation factor IF-3
MKGTQPEREKDDTPINGDIRTRQVQLIDETGVNHGLVQTGDAMGRAEKTGLDLVQIAMGANEIPIVKILDYGKFKFQSQKKAAEARKKQKSFEVKEIKMRPNIDDHDYEVKMRSIKRFFEEGDKVKITLRFRGREMAHQELGFEVLKRVRTETETFAKVESEPRFEGRQIVMMLAPRG